MGLVTRTASQVEREEAFLFGGGNRLVGFMTSPAPGTEARIPVVILNAGIIHRVGPNRLNVLLARTLAESGHPSLRFDLCGIGDSGSPRSNDLQSSVQQDIRDALDEMERRTGASRFVIAGLCSGADNAFAAAVRDNRIAGVVFLDGTTFRTRGFYAVKLLSHLRDYRSWRNLVLGRSAVWNPVRRFVRGMGLGTADTTPVEEPKRPEFYGMSSLSRADTSAVLRVLLERQTQLLYVFTGGIRHRYNHASQFRRSFPEVDFGNLVRLEYMPEADHTFSDATQRRRVIALIRSWLDGWPPRLEYRSTCESC